jgi:hypothetical protein
MPNRGGFTRVRSVWGRAALPEAVPGASGTIRGTPDALPPPNRPQISASPLGPPLGIRAVARLIGVSPWTVRQRLMPQGLPHFRIGASGKLIFYTHQVVAWITKRQGGSKP